LPVRSGNASNTMLAAAAQFRIVAASRACDSVWYRVSAATITSNGGSSGRPCDGGCSDHGSEAA